MDRRGETLPAKEQKRGEPNGTKKAAILQKRGFSMKENEKKHHFLYFIFQFDHKDCKMDEKREICLLENIRKAIALNQKGEQ